MAMILNQAAGSIPRFLLPHRRDEGLSLRPDLNLVMGSYAAGGRSIGEQNFLLSRNHWWWSQGPTAVDPDGGALGLRSLVSFVLEVDRLAAPSLAYPEGRGR